MPKFKLSLLTFAGFVLACVPLLTRADEKPKPEQSTLALQDYRTLAQAQTTEISKPTGAKTAAGSGYLGVHVEEKSGKLSVADLAFDSPAAKAGLQVGDTLERVNDQVVTQAAQLRDLVQAQAPDSTLQLKVQRKEKLLDLKVTLSATSKPLKVSDQRVILGVRFGQSKEGEGLLLEEVTRGGPADKAGLKRGALLLKFEDKELTDANKLAEYLLEKKDGDKVTLLVKKEAKDAKEEKVAVTLAVVTDRTLSGNWDARVGSYFRKEVYKLAVIGLEYPDTKRHEKLTNADWEEALFSRGKYVKKNNPTGQPVFGSVHDYYQELSSGKLKVEGKMLGFVTVSKKRAEYAPGTGTNPSNKALLTEAVDLLEAREGKEVLKEYDGIFFLYAGDSLATNRGSLYWPHRAVFSTKNKRWDYFIVPEGGRRMTNISVIAHEFGHMLGLPDLYARPENPGSEGVGLWCAMSNQLGSGRPQHFSAWCKEQLGWLKPTVVDPTVKQKLLLSPIEDSNECLKVLLRKDGSEYLLLENRRKKGFDTELPAEGLLIWRVVQGKVMLEEAHGVEGALGPRVYPNAVPYPSPSNNAFTPYTTPSSRSQLGGGLAVHLTNIRKLPDGRIALHLGYDYH